MIEIEIGKRVYSILEWGLIVLILRYTLHFIMFMISEEKWEIPLSWRRRKDLAE